MYVCISASRNDTAFQNNIFIAQILIDFKHRCEIRLNIVRE